jgi:hypothetical protein
LIGELSITNEAFRTLWARHDVRQKNSGRTRIIHPLVGELNFDYQALSLPAATEQMLITYAFVPGSPTDERLQLLMSWSGNTDGAAGP